jgi:hypothetical protein
LGDRCCSNRSNPIAAPIEGVSPPTASRLAHRRQKLIVTVIVSV